MWKKKDKGKDKGKSKERPSGGGGGGGLAAMLGVGGMEDFDAEDADLEAELLALEGKKPAGKKGSKEGGPKRLTMEEIQKLAAESTRDIDDDDIDDDDIDEGELLAELEGFEDFDESPPVANVMGRTTQNPSSSFEDLQRKPLSSVAMTTPTNDKAPQPSPRQPLPKPKSSPPQQRNTPSSSSQPSHLPAPSQQPLPAAAVPRTAPAQSKSPQSPPSEPLPKPRSSPSRPPQEAPPPAARKPAPAPPTPSSSSSSSSPPQQQQQREEEGEGQGDRAAARAILVERYKQYQELSASLCQQPQSSADTTTPNPTPSESAPSPSNTEEGESPASDPGIPIPKSPQEALEQRLQKYKSGVEASNKEGNSGKARRMGRIVKQYEDALKMVRTGKTVDFSELPVPPGYPPIPTGSVGTSPPTPSLAPVSSAPGREQVVSSSVQRSAVQPAASSPPTSSKPQPSPSPSSARDGGQGEGEGEEGPGVDSSTPQPSSPLEALQQRYAKYKSGQEAAQAEGNSSKARRMGRIVKQYEDAVKALKAGRPVDFEELPIPPGFPPIPLGGAKPSAVTTPPQQAQRSVKVASSLPPSQAQAKQPMPTSATNSLPSQLKKGSNLQQLELLKKRYAEYKSAALKCRQSGEREDALRLLRYLKDIKAYIDLAQKGLPIDESTIPPPLDVSETAPSQPLPPLQKVKASEGDDATFDLIQAQLQKQIDFCEENAQVYEKAGSRSGASRLRNMAEECRQELLAVKGVEGQGLAPPRFTIETRTVSLLNSFPHLGSSECEVEVVRLLDAPKDTTVYVEVEFPYPSDNCPKEQTPKAKDEVNPELKSLHVFPIERKQKRSLTRALIRGVKFNLWHHKALWKDALLGTAVVKPEELETKAEVRTTVSFYEGRKEIATNVEVAVRLREPLGGADLEEKQIQWIVFMEQLVKKSKVVMPKAKPLAEAQSEVPSKSETALSGPLKLEETFSVAALKVEYQLAGKNSQLQEKIKKKLLVIQQKLQTDHSFVPNYKKGVEASVNKETKLYQAYVKGGKQKEAKILLERVKAMQAELKRL